MNEVHTWGTKINRKEELPHFYHKDWCKQESPRWEIKFKSKIGGHVPVSARRQSGALRPRTGICCLVHSSRGPSCLGMRMGGFGREERMLPFVLFFIHTRGHGFLNWLQRERERDERDTSISRLLYTPWPGITPTAFCAWAVTPRNWATWSGQRLLPFGPEAGWGRQRERRMAHSSQAYTNRHALRNLKFPSFFWGSGLTAITTCYWLP